MILKLNLAEINAKMVIPLVLSTNVKRELLSKLQLQDKSRATAISQVQCKLPLNATLIFSTMKVEYILIQLEILMLTTQLKL